MDTSITKKIYVRFIPAKPPIGGNNFVLPILISTSFPFSTIPQTSVPWLNGWVHNNLIFSLYHQTIWKIYTQERTFINTSFFGVDYLGLS